MPQKRFCICFRAVVTVETDNDSYENSAVGEFSFTFCTSCFTNSLCADNASFKPKTGFTTEKTIIFTETTIFT